jgi:hypothetical protein
MHKHKTLLLTLIAVVSLTTVIIISSPQAQQSPSKSPPVKSKRKKDINHFPIANFSAEEPAGGMRRNRNEKRNKSNWRVHPDASGDSTVVVDSIDLTLPAFPTRKAAAVVLGTVTDARSYLSNDKTGVYSSFSIQVEEVLKNPGKLAIGSLIEGEREGGRVQFPSGRIRLYMIAEQDMPEVGSRYVFFLNDGDNETVFEIITGYEIRDSSVLPLDELPEASAYENSAAPEFLKELKTKLAKP